MQIVDSSFGLFRVNTSRERRVMFCKAVGCCHVLLRAYAWSDMMESYGGLLAEEEAYPWTDMLSYEVFPVLLNAM